MAQFDEHRRDLDIVRFTPHSVDAKDIAAIAAYAGRAHRIGDPVPLYTSETSDVAEREFGHHRIELRGRHVRRTRLHAQLRTADLLTRAQAEAAGTTLEALSAEAWDECQRVVQQAFAQGAEAVRLLSARCALDPTAINVVISRAALGDVRVVSIDYPTLGSDTDPET